MLPGSSTSPWRLGSGVVGFEWVRMAPWTAASAGSRIWRSGDPGVRGRESDRHRSRGRGATIESINHRPAATIEPGAGNEPSSRTESEGPCLHSAPARRHGALRDVLLDEGVFAARLASETANHAALRRLLEERFPQNSSETRGRSALSLLRSLAPLVTEVGAIEESRMDDAVEKLSRLLLNALKDAKARHGPGKRVRVFLR